MQAFSDRIMLQVMKRLHLLSNFSGRLIWNCDHDLMMVGLPKQLQIFISKYFLRVQGPFYHSVWPVSVVRQIGLTDV